MVLQLADAIREGVADPPCYVGHEGTVPVAPGDPSGDFGRTPCVAALVLALLLGFGAPAFPGGPVWHTGSVPPHACPGVTAERCVQASSWASTVRLRDCANCLPHKTLAVLPPDGIVIQLTVAREKPLRANRGAWPAVLKARDVYTGGEGIPRRFGTVQRYVTANHTEHMLWVFFGRPHPTAHQLAAVNAQLRGLRG